MTSAFLDASVLFAAAYSPTGFARDLILLATQEKVTLLTSEDVLVEAKRNLTAKAPDKAKMLDQLMLLANIGVTPNPTKAEVWAAEQYVAQKDAHVIAAAINAKPDYLVTYDQKHLLEPVEVSEKSGLTITTPDVVVAKVRNENSE